MDSGLTIAIVDAEVEPLGFGLTVSNGRFGGVVGPMYGGLDDLSSLAAGLDGFPASTDDARVFGLGSSGLGSIGWARLGFRVTDSWGHAVLDVQLSASGWTRAIAVPTPESASFVMPVDAASIDRFVAQLRVVLSSRHGAAHLESPS